MRYTFSATIWCKDPDNIDRVSFDIIVASFANFCRNRIAKEWTVIEESEEVRTHVAPGEGWRIIWCAEVDS
ncbi:MAG: hypothetical protein C4321_01590 [Chloroflexota bacterium]